MSILGESKITEAKVVNYSIDAMSRLKFGAVENNDRALNILVSEKEDKKLECWTELKVKDRFINKRSYQAAVIYDSKLYVYGGQDLNVGIYGDFNSIQLNEELVLSCWESVEVKGDVLPGPLSRMSNILIDHKWYLVGGTSGAIKNTSDIWCFDFKKKEWLLIKPYSTSTLLPIDSHSACLYKDSQGKQYIIVFGGFIGGSYGEYWNQVIKYDISENKWLLPYNPKEFKMKNPNGPSPRCGHTAEIFKDNMYVFAGTDGESRFNDTWKYDLVNEVWQQLITKEYISPRSGHTSVLYNDGFIIFGGIQDITHEKDDVIFFDFNKEQWRILDGEYDLSKVANKSNEPKPEPKQVNRHLKNKSILDSSPKRRSRSPTLLSNASFRSHKPVDSPLIKSNNHSSKSPKSYSPHKASKFQANNTGNSFILSQSELRASNSPGFTKNYRGLTKENEEKKKKLFLVRKHHFLKEFEITDPSEMLNSTLKSPTTEAMKNSIMALTYKAQPDQEANNLSSPLKIKKKTDLFSELLEESSLKIKMPINGKLGGHKPCARDGHSALLHNNYMIVFGGDRHKMAFNDIYVLTPQMLFYPLEKDNL